MSRADTGDGLWAVVRDVRVSGALVKIELESESGQVIQVELGREPYATLDLRVGERAYVRLRKVRVFTQS